MTSHCAVLMEPQIFLPDNFSYTSKQSIHSRSFGGYDGVQDDTTIAHSPLQLTSDMGSATFVSPLVPLGHLDRDVLAATLASTGRMRHEGNDEMRH